MNFSDLEATIVDPKPHYPTRLLNAFESRLFGWQQSYAGPGSVFAAICSLRAMLNVRRGDELL